MVTHRTRWIIGGIWIALALITWIALVPSWMSTLTFAGLNAGVAVFVLFAMGLARSATPSRSIGQVLYDAEHEASKPKR